MKPTQRAVPSTGALWCVSEAQLGPGAPAQPAGPLGERGALAEDDLATVPAFARMAASPGLSAGLQVHAEVPGPAQGGSDQRPATSLAHLHVGTGRAQAARPPRTAPELQASFLGCPIPVGCSFFLSHRHRRGLRVGSSKAFSSPPWLTLWLLLTELPPRGRQTSPSRFPTASPTPVHVQSLTVSSKCRTQPKK